MDNNPGETYEDLLMFWWKFLSSLMSEVKGVLPNMHHDAGPSTAHSRKSHAPSASLATALNPAQGTE